MNFGRNSISILNLLGQFVLIQQAYRPSPSRSSHISLDACSVPPPPRRNGSRLMVTQLEDRSLPAAIREPVKGEASRTPATCCSIM